MHLKWILERPTTQSSGTSSPQFYSSSIFQLHSLDGLRSAFRRPHFRLALMENLTGFLMGREVYAKEPLYLHTSLCLSWKFYIWNSYNLLNRTCNSPTIGSVSQLGYSNWVLQMISYFSAELIWTLSECSRWDWTGLQSGQASG